VNRYLQRVSCVVLASRRNGLSCYPIPSSNRLVTKSTNIIYLTRIVDRSARLSSRGLGMGRTHGKTQRKDAIYDATHE
jgi:hypothetical protein